MKKIFFILLLGLSVLFPMSAVAEVQTATLSAVEPTEMTDGSALTDLKTLRVYYYLKTGQANVVAVDYPASAPTGGGLFKEVIDINVPAGATVTYEFYMTAETAGGLESEPSIVGSKTFVSSLPPPKPNAPAKFTVLPGDQVNQFGQ